jgi:hypothetical protein
MIGHISTLDGIASGSNFSGVQARRCDEWREDRGGDSARLAPIENRHRLATAARVCALKSWAVKNSTDEGSMLSASWMWSAQGDGQRSPVRVGGRLPRGRPR